jgi:signal transduction histidine kinase
VRRLPAPNHAVPLDTESAEYGSEREIHRLEHRPLLDVELQVGGSVLELTLRVGRAIEVDAVLCDEPEASLEAKEAVYRIAQEALHNTVKHAHAANVQIKVKCDSEWITLEVSDDGIGFDAQGDFPGHLGLRSMRERALRLGGTLEVDSTSGKGTRICAQIPI